MKCQNLFYSIFTAGGQFEWNVKAYSIPFYSRGDNLKHEIFLNMTFDSKVI